MIDEKLMEGVKESIAHNDENLLKLEGCKKGDKLIIKELLGKTLASYFWW